MSNPTGCPDLMATPGCEPVRLRLPTRIRTTLGPDSDYAARFRLAELIAGLPHVHTIEDNQESLPCSVAVYLRTGSGNGRGRIGSVLFCKITSAGVSVEGLNDAERHQVLSRGWGQLENCRMLLFLPRDASELDVCWSILYRAYCTIFNSLAVLPRAPRAHLAELPEYSRTTLC